MKVETGFSLFELVVALAVSGILLSMGVPAMRTIVQNNRMDATVDNLLTTMAVARSNAMTSGNRVTICRSDNGQSCNADTWNHGWLAFVDTDASGDVNGAEVVITATTRLREVAIASAQFPSFFIYRSNGRIMVNDVSQNTGHLTFCDSRGADHALVVIADATGRPRASHLTPDGTAPEC